DRDAARIVLLKRRALAAELVRALASAVATHRLGPRAKDAAQRRERSRCDLGERRQPDRDQLLFCDRTDARKLAHRQGAEGRADDVAGRRADAALPRQRTDDDGLAA